MAIQDGDGILFSRSSKDCVFESSMRIINDGENIEQEDADDDHDDW